MVAQEALFTDEAGRMRRVRDESVLESTLREVAQRRCVRCDSPHARKGPRTLKLYHLVRQHPSGAYRTLEPGSVVPVCAKCISARAEWSDTEVESLRRWAMLHREEVERRTRWRERGAPSEVLSRLPRQDWPKPTAMPADYVRGAGARLVDDLKDAVRALYAGECQDCHSDGGVAVQVVPEADGGFFEPGNVTSLCRSCLKRKSVAGEDALEPLRARAEVDAAILWYMSDPEARAPIRAISLGEAKSSRDTWQEFTDLLSGMLDSERFPALLLVDEAERRAKIDEIAEAVALSSTLARFGVDVGSGASVNVWGQRVPRLADGRECPVDFRFAGPRQARWAGAPSPAEYGALPALLTWQMQNPGARRTVVLERKLWKVDGPFDLALYWYVRDLGVGDVSLKGQRYAVPVVRWDPRDAFPVSETNAAGISVARGARLRVLVDATSGMLVTAKQVYEGKGALAWPDVSIMGPSSLPENWRDLGVQTLEGAVRCLYRESCACCGMLFARDVVRINETVAMGPGNATLLCTPCNAKRSGETGPTTWAERYPEMVWRVSARAEMDRMALDALAPRLARVKMGSATIAGSAMTPEPALAYDPLAIYEEERTEPVVLPKASVDDEFAAEDELPSWMAADILDVETVAVPAMSEAQADVRARQLEEMVAASGKAPEAEPAPAEQLALVEGKTMAEVLAENATSDGWVRPTPFPATGQPSVLYDALAHLSQRRCYSCGTHPGESRSSLVMVQAVTQEDGRFVPMGPGSVALLCRSCQAYRMTWDAVCEAALQDAAQVVERHVADMTGWGRPPAGAPERPVIPESEWPDPTPLPEGWTFVKAKSDKRQFTAAVDALYAGECQLCGDDGQQLSANLVLPHREGGMLEPGNVVGLCTDCGNAWRGNFSDENYRRLKARALADAEVIWHMTDPKAPEPEVGRRAVPVRVLEPIRPEDLLSPLSDESDLETDLAEADGKLEPLSSKPRRPRPQRERIDMTREVIPTLPDFTGATLQPAGDGEERLQSPFLERVVPEERNPALPSVEDEPFEALLGDLEMQSDEDRELSEFRRYQRLRRGVMDLLNAHASDAGHGSTEDLMDLEYALRAGLKAWWNARAS